MTVICQWEIASKTIVADLVSLGLVDLLALGRSLPRSEILGSPLGKKVRSAVEKAERRIRNAAAQLEDLEIPEAEIRQLVEARVAKRMKKDSNS